MAKQAKYTLHVPTRDNAGQPLRDLAQAAHEHLFNNGAIEGSFIDRGKTGNWRDYAPEEMDHLVTFAEDSPETDSHLKQTAVHIGQLANQQAVTVTKESGAGPALWIINNPQWREDEGAHPSALQYVPAAQRGAVSRSKPRTATLLDYLDLDLPSIFQDRREA
jgi:hypothetical protein